MLRNASRRAFGRRKASVWRLNIQGAAAASIRAATSVGSRRRRALETPAAETRTSCSNRPGSWSDGVGGDEAAHRVADHGAFAYVERGAEIVQQAPVGGDRDLPLGHRRAAEARAGRARSPGGGGRSGGCSRASSASSRRARGRRASAGARARSPSGRAHLDVVDACRGASGPSDRRSSADARASRSPATRGPGCRRGRGLRRGSGRAVVRTGSASRGVDPLEDLELVDLSSAAPRAKPRRFKPAPVRTGDRQRYSGIAPSCCMRLMVSVRPQRSSRSHPSTRPRGWR